MWARLIVDKFSPNNNLPQLQRPDRPERNAFKRYIYIYIYIFNPRTGGGGVDFNPPWGFSQIARKRRRVAPPNLPELFSQQFDTFPKKMTRWPQRSRDQVGLNDLTSSCVFRSLTSCQGHTSDPNSLKLAWYSKGTGVYNLSISDFLYRWPEVMSISWPPHYKSTVKKISTSNMHQICSNHLES